MICLRLIQIVEHFKLQTRTTRRLILIRAKRPRQIML